MKRVLVMGCSGSGKSTFARALAERLALPFVSLDALFWKPGWVESDPETFGRRVEAIAQTDSWVMDGNYTRHGAGALRRERADAVFLFDLPRRVCLYGVARRFVLGYGKVRPEMADGCPERIDLPFLLYVWRFRRDQRPKLMDYLSGLRPDQTLTPFHSRAQARAVLQTL